MKKWILSAAFMLLLGGFASAQKQTTKDQKTTKQKTVKSGTEQKAKAADSKTEIKKDSSSHNAKIKLVLPSVDTSGMIPKNKEY